MEKNKNENEIKNKNEIKSENDTDEKLILDYIKKEKQFDMFYKNIVTKINVFFVYLINDKIVNINV